MEVTGDVKGDVFIKEAPTEFCLVIAKTALQLLNRRRRKDVEIIIQMIYDGNFDAAELRQPLNVKQ